MANFSKIWADYILQAVIFYKCKVCHIIKRHPTKPITLKMLHCFVLLLCCSALFSSFRSLKLILQTVISLDSHIAYIQYTDINRLISFNIFRKISLKIINNNHNKKTTIYPQIDWNTNKKKLTFQTFFNLLSEIY